MADEKQDDIKPNLFNEILATSKMVGYVGLGNTFANFGNDDPSYIWQQLQVNPWLAMSVYEDMELKDGYVSSALDTRKNGVLSKSHRVLPASESSQDKKIAEFIEETLRDYFEPPAADNDANEFDSGFEQFLYEALDAIGKGVSIGEIIFGAARDRIYIKGVKFKSQQLFNFGDGLFGTHGDAYSPQTGSLKLQQGVLLDNLPENRELPKEKFFVFSYQPRKGNRWGTPTLIKVYWAAWMKRASVRQWLKYQEKGTGVVIARYPGGASTDEQQKAINAATAIVEENAVAVPEKFLIEIHEVVRAMGDTHEKFVDGYCNKEIALAILGQTLTSRGSDGGGSRALGQVHDKVRGEKIEADAKALMNAVNRQIIRPLVLLNFGPNALAPKWTIDYEPQDDLNALAERFSTLSTGVGLPLPKGYLYETFQMPAPSSDDDALVPATKSLPPPSADKKADKKAEFAEKKTLKTDGRGYKSNSKTARFQRLNPSTKRFSGE